MMIDKFKFSPSLFGGLVRVNGQQLGLYFILILDFLSSSDPTRFQKYTFFEQLVMTFTDDRSP